ncbi:uncharacterized protein PHACADRAFT_46386, partial [Phanerochaete carnosa HHB-10118-sp]
QGHSKQIVTLSFSSNGAALVSESNNKTAIVWDVKRGYILQHLTEHCSLVDNTIYSPDGTLIATSDLKKSVKIWD